MLSIVVAFDKNRLIGSHNKMPWHFPEDMKYFKELTMGKTVVMGKNTYQSILEYLHKPLPGRKNIVITSKAALYPEIEAYASLTDFLKVYRNSQDEIFIIGGKSIYEQFLPLVKRLYITHINREFIGDVYFPELDYNDFSLISEKDVNDLRFAVYERTGDF